MKRAFTLIEMLVIIFLFGFMSSLAYFGFNHVRSYLDIDYAAKQVFFDMRLSQDLAKTVHYPHQIEFFRGGNKYQIVNLDGDEVVKKGNVDNSLRFSGKEIFIFSASGNPVVGGSGTLLIGNLKGRSRKLIVSPEGRIRIE